MGDETNEGGDQQVNPMQQRIDELTAKLTQQSQQMQQMQAQFSEQIARQPAPTQQTQDKDPYAGLISEGLSDEQKTLVRANLDAMNKLLDSRLNPVVSGMAALRGRDEMASFSEQKFAHLSDAVKKQAAAFYADWQARGGPAAAYTKEDAIKFAIGNAALAVDPREGQLISPAFANPTPRTVDPASAPLPSNFDDLDPDKQYEILAKRVGDKEI